MLQLLIKRKPFVNCFSWRQCSLNFGTNCIPNTTFYFVLQPMKRATFAQASATTGFLVFCWQRSAILYTDVAFVSVERTRLSANGRTLQEAVDRDRAIKAVCRRSAGRISTHRHWTEGRGTSRPLHEPLVDRHRLGLIDDRLLAVTVSWLCNT